MVFWTGGKDSTLALWRARRAGVNVGGLVTFVPTRGSFRAHPLSWMRAQSRALGLPHRAVAVARPYAAGYDRALRRLREDGVRSVITGDIDLVAGHPNWIESRAVPLGLTVIRPLWNSRREDLLDELVGLGYRTIITALRSPPMDASWLGRQLDAPTIAALCSLARARGFDASGEAGEYHTMTLDGPGFSHRLALGPMTAVRAGRLHIARFASVGTIDRGRNAASAPNEGAWTSSARSR